MVGEAAASCRGRAADRKARREGDDVTPDELDAIERDEARAEVERLRHPDRIEEAK